MDAKLISDIYIMIPVDISKRQKVLTEISIPDYIMAYLDKMKIMVTLGL